MKKMTTLTKAPEDMTREELVDALKLARATQWELQEQVRKLVAKGVDTSKSSD